MVSPREIHLGNQEGFVYQNVRRSSSRYGFALFRESLVYRVLRETVAQGTGRDFELR